MSASEIFDLIKRSDRCYQAVRGAVAEGHLELLLKRLVQEGPLTSYEFTNAEGEPDFKVFRGDKCWRVECKNVLRNKSGRFANGELKVDFQKTRNQLGEGARTGRYYKASSFEVLAACEYNQTRTWTFKFVRTQQLASVLVEGIRCINKSVRVPQRPPFSPWSDNLLDVLDPADAMPAKSLQAQRVLDTG